MLGHSDPVLVLSLGKSTGLWEASDDSRQIATQEARAQPLASNSLVQIRRVGILKAN